MRVRFPYGSEDIAIDIPDEKLKGVYLPRERPRVADLQAEIARARLADAAKGKKSAAIVVDDATRFVPSRELLPPLLKELQRAGIKLEDVVIIVATGLHRPQTDSELSAIKGDLPLRIVNHNCRDDEQLVTVGRTSLGRDVRINRTFMEADLKVLTGDVEYHQFCGYGGGVKSVYPGLADADSIEHNHSMLEVEGTGPSRIEGNPIRQEIEEVGRMVGVDFILNVVMNSEREVVRAFAGHPFQAFREATRLVDEMYRVEVDEPVDLVIASAGGYPRDIELYQAQKALTVGRRIVRKGGAVALIAECREGHGSDLFDEWMTEADDLDQIYERIKKKFIMGGHKAYEYAREIKWARVHLLSAIPPNKVKDYFMHPLKSEEDITGLIREADSVAALPQATVTLALLPGMESRFY